MTEQKQMEKFIESALDDHDLDWEVALVELNMATHSWNIELEVPNGPEVLITIPQGPPGDMKRIIKAQIDEEVDRVKAHRR